MEPQTLLVFAIVLGAALFAGNHLRRTLLAARTPTRGKGCDGDCGCSHD